MFKRLITLKRRVVACNLFIYFFTFSKSEFVGYLVMQRYLRYWSIHFQIYFLLFVGWDGVREYTGYWFSDMFFNDFLPTNIFKQWRSLVKDWHKTCKVCKIIKKQASKNNACYNNAIKKLNHIICIFIIQVRYLSL